MGIASGTYDRRITVQRAQQVQSATGQTNTTWIPLLSDVPARVKYDNGAQAFEADQRVSNSVITFEIRYTTTPIRAGYQVLFEGQTYNVTYVAEIGRRVAWQIRCETKDNV